MVSVVLRYDLRLADGDSRSRSRQMEAALEQVEWGDRLGFSAVMLNEHHGTDDGYLPSPVTFAAAVSQRTRAIRINIAALIAPLYDPLRLAEDLSVVDLLSEGRLMVTVGAGYVPDEFEMFGKSLSRRFSDVVRTIETLRAAWTGEPFEFEGRMVRVTPRPYQLPGPPILLGGTSTGAARRAARIADGFIPVQPELHEAYRSACVEYDRPDPGPAAPSGPRFLYVAEDPDQAWHEIAPYCLHETNSYAAWGERAGIDNGYGGAVGLDDLREDPNYVVATPEECVGLIRELGDRGRVVLHPLAGGMDPDLSWRSLDLFERSVLPHFT